MSMVNQHLDGGGGAAARGWRGGLASSRPGRRQQPGSGASVGMLVAASLAPPAGLLGMGLAMGQWVLVPSALFLLTLQLVGINLAGAAIFRLAGLSPQGPRYARGRSAVVWLSSLLSVIALVALITWQAASPAPSLQRSTLEQRARDVVRQAMSELPAVQLAGVEAEFTRPDIADQHTLLVRIYAQRQPDDLRSDDALRAGCHRAGAAVPPRALE
jgi:uncharacterized membrane protein